MKDKIYSFQKAWQTPNKIDRTKQAEKKNHPRFIIENCWKTQETLPKMLETSRGVKSNFIHRVTIIQTIVDFLSEITCQKTVVQYL